MAQWYVLQGGQPLGPLAEDEVRTGIISGRFGPADKVAPAGSGKWLDQHEVPEFADFFWASPEVTPAPVVPAVAPPPVQATPLPPVAPMAPPVQVHYHMTPPAPAPMYALPGGRPLKDKTTAGLLALLLGGVGAHHFYLGNGGLGVLYLLLWLFGVGTSWLGIRLFVVGIPGLFALIDGIIYLTKPDDQFQRNYHNWFCSGP